MTSVIRTRRGGSAMGAASTAKGSKGPQGRRAAWRMGEKGASRKEL